MRTNHPVIFLIFISLLIRLPIAYLITGAPSDIKTFYIIGYNTLHGINPYIEGHYFYFPFYNFWCAFSVWASAYLDVPFHFIVKLFPILSDAGIALLIYKITGSKKWSLLYAINPVSILIVAVHGQFDIIALFFLLLSIYFFKNDKIGYSAISFGMSVLAKTFPILVLPFFVSKLQGGKKRMMFAMVSLGIPLLSVMPYLLSTPGLVIGRIAGYSSDPNFGWTIFVKVVSYILHGTQDVPDFIMQTGKILILLGVALLWIHKRNEYSIEKLTVLVFLMFYVLSAGIAVQYLIWAVPFLFLTKTPATKTYLIIASISIVVYYNLYFPEMFWQQGHIINPVYLAEAFVIFNFFWWGLCITTAIKELNLSEKLEDALLWLPERIVRRATGGYLEEERRRMVKADIDKRQ